MTASPPALHLRLYMLIRRIWPLFFVILISGCTSDPDDNHHSPDGGEESEVALDASDSGDVRGSGDSADISDASDSSDTTEIDDAGDTDSEDIGDMNDASDTPDASDPVVLDPWSCAPDLALDSRGYESVEDLENEALLDGLYPLVADHISYTYSEARDYMYAELEPQEDGKIECVYTARRVFPDGTRTPGGFNTEHSWPQSEGASEEPPRSDLHHLFPSDADANSRRGSYEFGNVDCAPSECTWGESESYLGGSEDDNRNPVFEVRPERRGDIARAHFYFATRYEYEIGPEEESVLRQWHCEDPPDEFERTRNDGIEVLQENRNPFVDRPDFVDRIADF